MKKTFLYLAALILFQTSLSYVHASEKITIGWIEPVTMKNGSILLQAKMDTGADSSSLNATDIKKFTKDGDEWIRFTITSRQGDEYHLEKKVIKYIKIKRKLLVAQKRPVIKLNVCLAGKKKEVMVNLANRTNYKYPMLIGRNFLSGDFLIDSQVMKTSKPVC